MTDEAGAESAPAGRKAHEALSIGEQQLELDIPRLLFIVIAAACAVAVVEFLRWLFRGVGGRIGARHPFMTELVVDLLHRPRRRV
jgi:hypothetical protein